MSRIAGIFNLDGKKADGGSLSGMAAAITGQRSDGQKIWQDGPIGLAHSHFWTTPEELGEDQPISDADERYWIASDARLDNRDELIESLKGQLDLKVPSDAEIILASYDLWKEKCPFHLIGDFAFAIWDAQEQELFCARDPCGVRAFNYSQGDNALFFGSNIKAVIAGLKEVPRMNIPFLGDLLASRYDRWINETAYQGIFRLPPGYQLKATPKGVDIKRYWIFGQESYRFSTEEEYISRFREIFQEAIAARTRSIGPVGLSVSGGLDSSSIACKLNDLISAGRVQADVRLYSLVYDHTPTLDEKEFLDAVEDRCPHLKFNRILADDIWNLHEFGNDDGYPLENPEIMSGRGSALAINRMAVRDGCRVLLSGLFGDEALGAPYAYSPQLLRDIEFKCMRDELRYFLSYAKSPWQLFLSGYLTYVLPPWLKEAIKSVFFRKRSAGDELPNFLSHLCDPDDSYQVFFPSTGSDNRLTQLISNTIMGGLTAEICINMLDLGAHTGIDYAFPFLDRRLIDFLLSVPPMLLFKQGSDKYILRMSMKGILPERVRVRKGKAFKKLMDLEELKEDERFRVDRLISDSRSVCYGLVVRPELEAAYELYLNGKYPSHLMDRYLCLESWIRSYEQNYNRDKSFLTAISAQDP